MAIRGRKAGIGLLVGLAPLLGGCFQADLHATLMPDASGKLTLELAVHKSRLPFFLKDPLRTVDDPHVMRRNTTVGIVAWGEPLKYEVEGWERVILTAYFEDINNLRFYKTRPTGPAKILAFHFQPPAEPRVVKILADLEPELTGPIPLDKLSQNGSVEVNPSLVRQLLPTLRPLLGDVRMSLRVTAPGPLTRASGFGEIDGRRARRVGDRDDFLDSIRTRAGALVDADSLLAENPEIRWTEDTMEPEELASFREDMAQAKVWWAAQFPPKDDAANRER